MIHATGDGIVWIWIHNIELADYDWVVNIWTNKQLLSSDFDSERDETVKYTECETTEQL